MSNLAAIFRPRRAAVSPGLDDTSVQGSSQRWGWLLAAGVAAFVLLWALASYVFEELRFAAFFREGNEAVEAASTLARLFGALVLFLFPTDRGGHRLRWVAGGFLVLGLGGLVFDNLLPLMDKAPDTNTSMCA